MFWNPAACAQATACCRVRTVDDVEHALNSEGVAEGRDCVDIGTEELAVPGIRDPGIVAVGVPVVGEMSGEGFVTPPLDKNV